MINVVLNTSERFVMKFWRVIFPQSVVDVDFGEEEMFDETIIPYITILVGLSLK